MTNLTLSRRGLILGASALTLAGCGSILGPSSPPPQIYLLQPQFGPVDAPTVKWQLAVGMPSSDDSLDRQRIALHRGLTMDYYADAQWTDEAPKVIQTLFVEAFEKSGHIGAVGRDSDGIHAEYLLQMELRDFEARYDNGDAAPEIAVDIVAHFLKLPGREALSTLEASKTVRASANSIPAVVEAFNEATGQVVEQIVAWALRVPGGGK